VSGDTQVRLGWVAPDLHAEFPELALQHVTVEASSRRSPRAVKERLRHLSDRYTGGKAVNLRQEPMPWAYRVFFRQIGFDPDDHRTPQEETALERMKHGGFRSAGMLYDALTIALVETGVPVRAFDADRVQGTLGLRLSEDRERLGGEGRTLTAGQIVVADELHALEVLFTDVAEGHAVGPATKRILLAAVQVKGVPQVSVEEALWTVADTVGEWD
jgi:DNA/RNA-binding domain of Phe-tRNA-synthetase-like protein